jgi:hypothetical protein
VRAIANFNRWYDTLHEPLRLILCLVFVSLGTAAVDFGGPRIWVQLLGMGYLVALLRMRMWWLEQAKKES